MTTPATDHLQSELQQSRPFPPEEEALLNVLRTANEIEQRRARFFKPYGVTPSQYNVLRILRGAHPDALPCAEIGGRLITPVPDVTRLLDRLEGKGWVARERGKQDRRVVHVAITDGGLELLARIDDPLETWLVDQLGHLPAGELRRLSSLLVRARRGPRG